jgi:hypothetical protein
VHEPFITVVGNLAAAPTLRTPNGMPVASFRIARHPPPAGQGQRRVG